MFKKIVVPVDGSDLSGQIVPYAAALASASGVELELLHVIDPDTVRVTREEEGVGITLASREDSRKGWALSYLRQAAEQLKSAGVTAVTRIEVGAPEEVIVAAAGTEGDVLVAMATHGRTGLPRMMLGSVADKVLHAGHMPLLLFRPRDQAEAGAKPPKTIIVPLNFQGADAAMPMARFLARSLGAKIILERTVSPVPYLLPEAVAVGSGSYPEELLEPAEREARAQLQQQVDSLQHEGLSAEAIVMTGGSGEETIRLASTTPDALVVMATHARSGVSRTVMGSIAERIVRDLGSPVLVVRP